MEVKPKVKLILCQVGTCHWLAHSWSTAEFKLSRLLVLLRSKYLALARLMAMTASIELNDFSLVESSGLRAALVIHAAWLRLVHLVRAQPSVFCFGLTGDSVSLLTAALGSLDVISLTESSIPVAVKHESPN